MQTRDFDYSLPESAIAQRPAERGTSRLLVLDAEGEARHRRVADLPGLLRPGDLLVVNDTRVIPARLFARRLPGGGKMELLLTEKLAGEEWLALARPGRRAHPGTRLEIDGELGAEILERRPDGQVRLVFSSQGFSSPIEPHLERLGHVPLPPYIHRPDDRADLGDYQTVFARHPGAIAAPTAGLHFSPELLGRLEAAGIERTAVTLHVGIGTFKPVGAEEVEAHVMESERYAISDEAAAAIARARARGGRVVAIGTTVVRTLETAAIAGGGVVVAGDGRSELFIRPGFPFRAVDGLLTNFHLPRSTLLMLVSAFAGRERVLAAYVEALERGYRFYSYGDAMLAWRRG